MFPTKRSGEKTIKSKIWERSTPEAIELALDASGAAMWHGDLRTGEVFITSAWARFMGLPAAETLTTLQELMDIVHPEDVGRVKRLYIETVKGCRHAYECEHRVRTYSGDWKWILSRGMVTERDPSTGRALSVAGSNVDINARKQAEEALKSSEERLRLIADNVPGCIAYVDADGIYRYNNQVYEHWFAVPRSEITGRAVSELMGPGYQAVKRAIEQALRGVRVNADYELERNGSVRHVSATFVPASGADGSIRGLYVFETDVSLIKETQARLEEAARRDPLTSLANRRLLEDRLWHAIHLSRRERWTLAVLYVDIDKFKAVNDTYGHAVGDKVLVEFSKRICGCVRKADTVGRVGGDEFVVVMEDVKGAHGAEIVANKIIEAISRPIDVGQGAAIVVNTSIGIAVHRDNEALEEILARADRALYQAKEAGRNAYRLAA